MKVHFNGSIFRVSALLIVVVLFAWLAWPTPYIFTKITSGDMTYLLRIHRVSGNVDILRAYGWQQMKPTSAPGTISVPLDQLQLAPAPQPKK